jgi:NADH-quinone oxidoreductase subunit J
MLEAIAFYSLATLILGFGVMVITARSAVHSVVFLVLDFLTIAVVYVVLGAEFLAVIQVLVYAGGIVVLYRAGLGIVLAAAVLAEVTLIVFYTASTPAATPVPAPPPAITGNTEQVGMILYTDYLIPFEVASMLLLAAMVGAILFARKAD